jgi:dihydroorotase
MKLLISRARIIDPLSPHHNKKCDVFIENGTIVSIQSHQATKKHTGYTVFDAKEQWLMPAFVDLRAHSGEPGFEQKETLKSLANAAHRGGFSAVVCRPDTLPVIQSKNDIIYFYNQAKELAIHLWPTGALTQNCEGKEMNELYDMHQAGAVAFSNADRALSNAGVLLRSLQYCTIFDGLVMLYANDSSIAAPSGVNEGETSTYIGIKGMPSLAEELMVVRDLKLAKYANAPIHFSRITTAASVELIKKAKKENLQVTCDVSVAHLIWDDTALDSYNSNYKLTPPLRNKKDKQALWNGLIDGTIDAICTDHFPQDIEHKQVEFEYASPGMIQLQTACSLLMMHAPKNFDIANIVNHLSHHPRNILKKPLHVIQVGNACEWILFDPNAKWNFDAQSNQSMSHNSPVLGKTLQGKVMATFFKNIFKAL